MASEPDEPVRKRIDHQLGEILDDLSVDELEARVARLREEISRLEAAKTGKLSAQAAAHAFFKA